MATRQPGRKTLGVHTIDHGPVRRGTVDRRRQLWLEATAEIERRYAEPLTVAEVARSIGTSTRQFQRVFDEAGGRSFRAHLAAVRMEHAKEMLLDHGGTVRSIAAAVGYSQPAQFAKAFARDYGVTPSRYRARCTPPADPATPPPGGACVC